MRLYGLMLAILSAVAFGLYMVPRRFSRAPQVEFSAAMGLGAAIALAIPLPFVAGTWSLSGLGIAFLGGLSFALASHLFVLSVDALGLTRATPVKNLTGVFGTFFGIAILGEYRTSGAVVLGQLVLGSLLTALGAYLIGGIGQTADDGLAPGGRQRGFLLAIGAAAFFGFYLVPLKLAAPLGTGYGYLGLGLGAVVGLTLPQLSRLVRMPLREAGLGALAGALLALGVLLAAPAANLIGLSVAWPITQLNTFVALGAGMFWLREHDFRQVKGRLLLASLATLAGILLLALL
ncbi:MAG: GRP family sugar transporter [Thermaerobacter sp.]|nr:GRP family sugar transporter [Thermaerobacter sp.]